jgi:hypothetical protein
LVPRTTSKIKPLLYHCIHCQGLATTPTKQQGGSKPEKKRKKKGGKEKKEKKHRKKSSSEAGSSEEDVQSPAPAWQADNDLFKQYLKGDVLARVCTQFGIKPKDLDRKKHQERPLLSMFATLHEFGGAGQCNGQDCNRTPVDGKFVYRPSGHLVEHQRTRNVHSFGFPQTSDRNVAMICFVLICTAIALTCCKVTAAGIQII